jgi:hypothetical protein
VFSTNDGIVHAVCLTLVCGAALVLPGCQHSITLAPAPSKAPQASKRLTAAEVTALGESPKSLCSSDDNVGGQTVAGCVVVGPFPGQIANGSNGKKHALLADALAECGADPTCVGVTSEWYSGFPWKTASGAARPAVSDDSYACLYVLSCPPTAR